MRPPVLLLWRLQRSSSRAIVTPEAGRRIIPSGGWASGAGGRRDDRGHPRPAARSARHRERAAHCLYAVAEPLEPEAVLLTGAAAAVVGDLDRQEPLGALCAHDDVCGIRVLVRVRDRLGDHVVHRRLCGLVESLRRQLAQGDRDDRARRDALDRVCEAEIGQDARPDAVSKLANLVDRDEKLALGFLEYDGGWPRRLVERLPQLVGECGETLLCAVVKMALKPAALDVACSHVACERLLPLLRKRLLLGSRGREQQRRKS